MSYELEFEEKALKKFDKLNRQIAEPFITKSEAILEHPKTPSKRLRASSDLYQIKLRSAGYRLVYHVIDERVVIIVIDVDKRDTIYKNM